MRHALLFAAALCGPPLVCAADADDAANPRAPALSQNHCSVLRPAQPASAPAEPQPQDWRAANAATAAAGGWRAYAREAARTPARPASPCPPRAAASGAHP